MSATTLPDDSGLTPELIGLLDMACDRFESAWLTGGRPALEEYLATMPAVGRPALFRELLSLELGFRRRHGERPEPGEYRARFPAQGAAVDAAFTTARDQAEPAPRPHRGSIATRVWIRAPRGWPRIYPGGGQHRAGGSVPSVGTERARPLSALPEPDRTGHAAFLWRVGLRHLRLDLPARVRATASMSSRVRGRKLGRFELLAAVGAGAFGTVYKARDPQLDRTVAIKVPRAGNLPDGRGAGSVPPRGAERRPSCGTRRSCPCTRWARTTGCRTWSVTSSRG